LIHALGGRRKKAFSLSAEKKHPGRKWTGLCIISRKEESSEIKLIYSKSSLWAEIDLSRVLESHSHWEKGGKERAAPRKGERAMRSSHGKRGKRGEKMKGVSENRKEKGGETGAFLEKESGEGERKAPTAYW